MMLDVTKLINVVVVAAIASTALIANSPSFAGEQKLLRLKDDGRIQYKKPNNFATQIQARKKN